MTSTYDLSSVEREMVNTSRRMGLGGRIWEYWLAFKFVFRSLTYNSFTSTSTTIDVAMEPVIWIVEHITKYMGPMMVGMVILLTTGVVLVMYTVVLPESMVRSSVELWIHLIFGQWLLVNIIFHYYKSVTTKPGYPPPVVSETGAGGICKKCIGPKPLRTHHCSVCRTCILKMDHHCPWINNCVGHFNHRYFMLFCIYMTIGTIYVTISVWPQFRDEFFDARKTFESLFGDSIFAKSMEIYNQAKVAEAASKMNETELAKKGVPVVPPKYTLTFSESMHHKAVVYEFFVCTGVTIALGGLTLWHSRLVSRGETSIEKHINDDERKRLSKLKVVYKNPYDFGVWKNWQILLGINVKHRSFIMHVLLPSSHLPEEDGVHWINQLTPGYVPKSVP
ncbi:palmitoyltransferase ZDHHC16-like [Lytechinus variegatus]|uniref:palmitoyltransferase ZDHHC16-like n=1 Tax=Lytechinus variegatus TaxID=7654 RepID=UPI001BB18297|nr:palmitoyltransferase ZDHHC16-like [Lytechinus variegatus]